MNNVYSICLNLKYCLHVGERKTQTRTHHFQCHNKTSELQFITSSLDPNNARCDWIFPVWQTLLVKLFSFLSSFLPSFRLLLLLGRNIDKQIDTFFLNHASKIHKEPSNKKHVFLLERQTYLSTTPKKPVGKKWIG